jgi:hypothetical protein
LDFRLEVKYEDGSIAGVVEDQDLKLNGEAIRLSQVEQITFGQRAKVKLRGGAMLQGTLSGLDKLSMSLGKQSLSLSLANASEAKVDLPSVEGPVSCVIVVRQAGKELARPDEPLYVQGSVETSMDALRDGKFVKPPRSTSPVSYLRVVSSKGDYIGAGKSYSYSGEVLTVQRNQRGVSISVEGPTGWRILFGAPNGQFLDVGEYQDAKRFPFSDASPGIEFTGQGRGCNQISGQFMVWEFETSGNEVTKLAVDFIQRCENSMAPLYGRLRFRSSFH